MKIYVRSPDRFETTDKTGYPYSYELVARINAESPSQWSVERLWVEMVGKNEAGERDGLEVEGDDVPAPPVEAVADFCDAIQMRIEEAFAEAERQDVMAKLRAWNLQTWEALEAERKMKAGVAR